LAYVGRLATDPDALRHPHRCAGDVSGRGRPRCPDRESPGMDEASGTRESLVPIVGWLRGYDRGWLRGDLVAGVTVAALIVPKNLGYAGIAGIPLQNGLYAAAAGATPSP